MIDHKAGYSRATTTPDLVLTSKEVHQTIVGFLGAKRNQKSVNPSLALTQLPPL
jgi:hypothetical protein